MKIPKSIHCASHEYECVYERNLTRDFTLRGQVVFPHRRIQLDDELNGTELGVVFLHEIVHIIDRHYCDASISEGDIHSLAEGLYQVFSDMGITFTK